MRQNFERDTPDFDRALAFFDAVYGFALTLLVVNIDVTGADTWSSVSALLSANGTQFTSFMISFVVIVAFWRKNHELVARMTGLDGSVMVANIVVIGFVVFLPFTTEAMGDPDLDHLALPTALYAFNVALAVIASVVMFQLALRHGLVSGDDPPAATRVEMWDALATPTVFLLSIPVTYAGVAMWGTTTLGKASWLLMFVVGPVSGMLASRAAARARAECPPAGAERGGEAVAGPAQRR